MTDRAYDAVDVDTDVIAQVLHDLADDIQEEGVLVESHKSFVEVESDDPVTAGIALEFIPKVGSRSVGNFAQQYEDTEEVEVIRE